MIILIAVIALKLLGLIICNWETIFTLFIIQLIYKYIRFAFFDKWEIKNYNSPFTKD